MMRAGSKQQGATMVEVLITMGIFTAAMLGLASAQTQSLQSQAETYEHSKAILLLRDAADRVETNRQARGCYSTVVDGALTPLGKPTDDMPACVDYGDANSRAIAARDLSQWDELLDGATAIELGREVGGIPGARGCLDYDPVADTVTITVAWRGRVPLQAPASACGRGSYPNDRVRRVVTQTITFAELG